MKIGDIANWVVKRTRRPDLLDIASENAANFYIVLCGAVPFEELEVTGDERAMVSGQGTYDISDLPVGGICNLRFNIGSASAPVYRRPKKSSVRTYDSTNNIPTGPPATYARWGLNLEFRPVPSSSSFTYRIRYRQIPVVDTTDYETCRDLNILTPRTWDQLIRLETLYQVYIDQDEMDKAMSLVMPMQLPRQNTPTKVRVFEYAPIPKLWNDLLKTVRQRETEDDDYSINPVVRRYTHGL